MGRNVVEQLLHGDEDAHVVGGGGEHQMAVLERGGHDVGRRRHRCIEHLHPDTLFRQTAGQHVGSVLRAAVHRGVGDHHAPYLRLIPAPQVVLTQQIAQLLPPHKAV